MVLVVDDDKDIREMLTDCLENSGYEPLACADGQEALEFTRQWPHNIAVVLSDVDMPRMDGLELCLHLSRERPETKFLLMTGKLELLQAPGSPVVLRKPFRQVELLKRLEALMEEQGRASVTEPRADS